MRNSLAIVLLLLVFGACKKTDTSTTTETPIPSNPKTFVEMKVPKGFQFESTISWDLQLYFLTPQDKQAQHVVFWLSTNTAENQGKILFTGKTDAFGRFRTTIKLPSTLKQVILNTNNLSIAQDLILPVSGSQANFTLGGSKPQLLKSVQTETPFSWPTSQKNASKFSYLCLSAGWGSTGVPNNLVVPRDVVSNQLINNIWSALPSRVSVAINHPTWLDDNACKRTLLVKQTADVWVTFLTEGAGYTNTLFYYRYNKNNPPTSAANIDSLFLVYPNASLSGSGGGLITGDKVYLGRFGPDTVIAYGIVANGYNATTNTVGNGLFIYYANKDFNPESNPTQRQHMVLLNDISSNKFIMGFEDLNRMASGCDHDFNDVLFYTTSNPINAVSADSVIALPASNDDDGDGVNNVDDAYPNDALRAFNNYYPALNTFATLAYEDLWPYYGDYDLNDVVIDFNYKVVSNAQNEAKDVLGKYELRASGGQIENAFAVEFPALATNISNLTGASIESGQTKAVLKVINNIRAVQNRWNTILLDPTSATVNYTVSFSLNTPIALATFGVNEYNPFIWGTNTGKNRGMEIHLPGKTPTALANTTYFGTGDDRTDLTQNKFYLSKDNLPWAILIPERFDYPIEKADILTAHLKFAQWAQSGGINAADWYKNLTGYRNTAKIYQKP